MKSYALNPLSQLFGNSDTGQYMVHVGPYRHIIKSPINSTFQVTALSAAAEANTSAQDLINCISLSPQSSLLQCPLVNFEQAFTTFLRWMIAGTKEHPPPPHSSTSSSPATQLPDDLNQFLLHNQLECFKATLTILRSPTTRELCVVFAIHHLSFKTNPSTPHHPTPHHHEPLNTLGAKLRHLLFCYQNIAPYLGAQVQDNSFQIGSAYLTPYQSTTPVAPPTYELIWGQPKISWKFFQQTRWLDPWTPYWSHHDFYAAIWTQIVQLVGPGAPTAKDRHWIWITGDKDGSLGLRLHQEAHHIISFHHHLPSSYSTHNHTDDHHTESRTHDTPTPNATDLTFWQQLHKLNPGSSSANAHYVNLLHPSAPLNQAVESSWAHCGNPAHSPPDLLQDLCYTPTYLIAIAHSLPTNQQPPAHNPTATADTHALSLARHLITLAEHHQTLANSPAHLPEFIILVTQNPPNQLWNRPGTHTRDAHHPTTDHHHSHHNTYPQNLKFPTTTKGHKKCYSQKQSIALEMVAPTSHHQSESMVKLRQFITIYQAQPHN